MPLLLSTLSSHNILFSSSRFQLQMVRLFKEPQFIGLADNKQLYGWEVGLQND